MGVKPLESANAPEKPLSLSSHNKWRNALRSAVTEKNRRLEKRLKQSRKKVAALRKQLSRVKKRECTNFAANPKADSSTAFRPVMRGLLDAQVKLSQCKKKGMRWSNQMKDFALSVLYHGPRAYRFLRTVIPLPSISTLNRYQQTIRCKPGLHDHVTVYLSENVPKWKTTKKLCCIVIDEMSIMKNVEYDSVNDQVSGYVDDSINRKKILADQVIIASVKGVTHSWKQIVGHWFSHNKSKTEVLSEVVSQLVNFCNNVGLIPKVLICDQSSKNSKLASKLGVTRKTPYFLNGAEKIYFMFDPPHLIKSLRNNLLKYDLMWRKNTAKWSHIKSLYTHQEKFRVNLIPKITRRHIFFRSSFQKMKVKLATQVFSQSVYIALLVFVALNKLPSSALHTASVVKDLNDFFDCFNSTQFRKDKFTLRYAMSKSSDHITFLKDRMLKYFDNAAFVGVRRQPPCLQGCIVTTMGLLSLVEDLSVNYKIKKIRTRFLNQDMLENAFSTLRQQQGCADNPTSRQVERGLRAMTLSSLSKINNSSNCESEVEKAVLSLSNLPKVVVTHDKTPVEAMKDVNPNEEMDLAEENALYYCAGFLTRKFLETHDCETCKKQLLVEPSERMLKENYQMFLYFKAHSKQLGCEFGHLYAPCYEAFRSLKTIDNIFHTGFSNAPHIKNVRKTIIKTIESHNIKLNLCSEKVEEKFIDMYITKRIHWEVRFINRRMVADEERRKALKKLNKLNVSKTKKSAVGKKGGKTEQVSGAEVSKSQENVPTEGGSGAGGKCKEAERGEQLKV